MSKSCFLVGRSDVFAGTVRMVYFIVLCDYLICFSFSGHADIAACPFGLTGHTVLHNLYSASVVLGRDLPSGLFLTLDSLFSLACFCDASRFEFVKYKSLIPKVIKEI